MFRLSIAPIKDPRMEQVRKIIESLVSKTQFIDTKVFLTTHIVYLILDDTILYEVPLKDVVEELPPYTFIYGNIINLEPDELINDVYIAHYICDIVYNYLNSCKQEYVVSSNTQLRGLDWFESLLELKAADGMRYYNMKSPKTHINYHIPIFSGFPALNKQDTVGITIYDSSPRNTETIIKYNIFKKKINREINMYFRILKI